MAQIITTNSGGGGGGGSNVNLIAGNGIDITHQTTYELPEGYTQVQRIATQSSGQYINSEITVDNDMEATFIADVPYINGGALLFGNNVNSNISCTLNVGSVINPRSRFGSTSMQYTLRRVGRHTYKISKNGIDVDTAHYNWDATPGTFLQAASSFIFAARGSTAYCPAQTRLYYGNIVKNGDVIAEFIPCIDIQNETQGLYDITNNRFLPISSGSLTVGGPVVPGEVISFVNDAGYLASSDVVDNLTSTATNKPLSANQGRILDGKISNLMAMGKFLSLWDAADGSPISFPRSTPYTYHTGDYFMVETLATGDNPNYRPTGSSYTGATSSVEETGDVQVGDFYVYDGSIWLLASNHGKTVSFANLAGQPTDNANLSNALAAKQNTLIAGTDLSITPGTEADIISFTNASRYIKNSATGDGSITISGNPAPGNNGVNIGPGSYAAGYSVGIGSGAYSNGGYSVAIGNASTASSTSAIGIGRGAKAQSVNGVAIGRDAAVSGLNGIAIGKDAKNSSAYAIQLGKGTIGGASNECQFYVGFDGINQNWKMLDGNTGLIPDARLSSNVQTVSNLVTTLTGADDTHYPSAKAVADAITSAGGGDMLKSTYDPNNVEADAFDYTNFINTPTIPTKTSDLTNDSDFLKNKATGTSALTILGTETAKTQAINIGASSQATANYGTALGAYSQANGSHAIAIGNYARTTGQYTIQLGKGTTSANNKLYAGFESNNYELLDGTTGKIPNDRLNMDATPTDSSTNAVTSGGVHSAIAAINGTIIAATAPLSPTEGMVWYDTTNDVLKTYDGSNWNEVGGGSNDVNTKTFYLSSSSDTTTAQAALDWYLAGKNPIVVLASTEYFVRSSSATELNFTSGNLYSVNSASGYSYNYVKGLKFALSSGTVTSVSSSNMNGGNYLKVDYNYSTPYTPQYDGSPATKKYVDDAVAGAGGIQNDTTGTTSTIEAEWVGTDTEFKALSSYGNKIYNIIE